jgi:hypothetical protein
VKEISSMNFSQHGEVSDFYGQALLYFKTFVFCRENDDSLKNTNHPRVKEHLVQFIYNFNHTVVGALQYD